MAQHQLSGVFIHKKAHISLWFSFLLFCVVYS